MREFVAALPIQAFYKNNNVDPVRVSFYSKNEHQPAIPAIVAEGAYLILAFNIGSQQALFSDHYVEAFTALPSP